MATIVTYRFPLRTTIGAHGLALQLAAYGRFLGLSIEYETVGGWFEKTHYFTAYGADDDIRKLMRETERVVASYA